MSEVKLDSPPRREYEMSSSVRSGNGANPNQPHQPQSQSPPPPQQPPPVSGKTTIVDEAQECLAQSLLMFLYADLRLLSATGRINTKFETLCVDSDRVPRTSAAQMAQLPGNGAEGYSTGGVSPGQIMAILIVELRQEVLSQRRRVRERVRKRGERDSRDGREGLQAQGVRSWVQSALLEDEEGESDSDDDDAGVMNKITDRKGRKEFESNMHSLIRSYNGMLSRDMKGMPEVKLRKMMSNPIRRLDRRRSQRPWLRPGGLTQRLFSFDEMHADRTGQGSDDESDDNGSKRSRSSAGSAAAGKIRNAARTIGNKLAIIKSMQQFQLDSADSGSADESPQGTPALEPSERRKSIGVRGSAVEFQPQLSQIDESQIGESDRESEGKQSGEKVLSNPDLDHSEEKSSLDHEADLPKDVPDTAKKSAVVKFSSQVETIKDDDQQPNVEQQPPLTPSVSGKLTQSKLFEIMNTVKGLKSSYARDGDLHSLKSDPGPNQSWNMIADNDSFVNNNRSASRGNLKNPGQKVNQIKENLTNYVEKVREDHMLHGNKLFIPSEDYETFAGAEDVGDNLMNLTSSMNMGRSLVKSCASIPQLAGIAEGGVDPDRIMSEKELLDFMTKCIESRNVDSLDFMADFFRDNTVSKTMVQSKAQVVWLQDWFPIKDCVYAISVDKEKKRVLVVFRGAITRADWNHGFDAAMKRAHNPVKDDYEDKIEMIKIHRGFHRYLFRVRKDTSTTKYDEIASKVYEYGNKMIGGDFTVTVNGYSLGGALSQLFGFFASCDDRFTRNGPIKIFSYGAPYVGGHAFADAFRHQERIRKLQHARFYNSNDIVAHLPLNMKPTRRGSNFTHVGVDIKLYPAPGSLSCLGSKFPRIRHNDRQTSVSAYGRALWLNSFLNTTYPWAIKQIHGLEELQKRIARTILLGASPFSKNPFITKTLDEVYEATVYKKQD